MDCRFISRADKNTVRGVESIWSCIFRYRLPNGIPVMDWQHRIVSDPAILVGKPVIRGTRIAVEFLIELLAEGWSTEEILTSYPQLTGEDIQAALHYATDVLKHERVFPLPV